MSVSNVSSTAVSDVYGSYSTSSSGKTTETAAKTSSADEVGVVYEKSTQASSTKSATYSINKMSAEDRAALVQQLKADQESRQQSLTNLVSQMIGKQANASNLASLFSPENLKNVDAATIAQAKEDVSEDGYYGIKQTSQRLFDFASALAGDDVDKMKEMQEAMQKGFEKATKAWGTTLPDICQKTIDAANQLFTDYYDSKQ
jgi:glycine cleavage system regulatory protein